MMDINKYILLIILLTLGLLKPSPSTDFHLANSYYEKGEFEKAAETYMKIINDGYENAETYYNLGNSYYRTGDIAKAIVNYERALLLRPGDGDTLSNLRLARMNLADKTDEDQNIPLFSSYSRLKEKFSVHSITGSFYFSLYLFGFMLCIGILPFTGYIKRIFKVITYLTFAIFLILSVIYYDIYSHNSKSFGIISADRAAVLSSPDDNIATRELFYVHLGTKAQIIRSGGDRYEIYLGEDRRGWIDKTAVIEI